MKMELVLVKAGEFDMGSNDGDREEKPVHKVKISKPFYIGKYDVTVAQFRASRTPKYQTEAEKQNVAIRSDGERRQVAGGVAASTGATPASSRKTTIPSWS